MLFSALLKREIPQAFVWGGSVRDRDEDIRFKELSVTHGMDECDGIMVPKFIYVTSQTRLHIAGYCVKCGTGLIVEYDLAELQKVCPNRSDENSRSVVSIAGGRRLPQLADFEPPPGSKPQ
jgi:hypothetical protein